ncbi:MAG: DUF433 domain-containing protein [Candidatus Omnitrophica bacterium]|nr:DUF433 domain-containing protein [Candidatus Omnitrophota bacterium]MBU0896626.1 DUF433 domain-containing protein [Candidatus Omnitrophota bacterium]MBU1134728.1 DUF433 domain-containing protein [Candidatus Omnitrophota bacterium]MBU1367776.1 DUF433 domain-containing protein [Candidatus Omnitrophota bacterium]MBU1524073.1 DUF433 domain-containing protein [Candidatus Omnitrophota bacterium]
MNNNNLLARISINSDICHGAPCIRGHRIMVWQILDLLAAGVKPEKIISEDYFPQITLQDIGCNLCNNRYCVP